MGNPDNSEDYYGTLGLSPDASMDQVKKRYKELSDAYLKILELSRSDKSARPPVDNKPKSPQTHTEPISTIKEKFAKGQINENQFQKLAMERYDYLKNKPFADLSDSELEERLRGFEKLKIDPRYWK